jgi:hypothetical protein
MLQILQRLMLHLSGFCSNRGSLCRRQNIPALSQYQITRGGECGVGGGREADHDPCLANYGGLQGRSELKV